MPTLESEAEKSTLNIKQAVPFFWVSNIEASLRFYVDGLGFQRTNHINPKINFEKVASFRHSKYVRLDTTIHQQSTTNSPAKNHVLHPVFCKTPSKNAPPPRQKN